MVLRQRTKGMDPGEATKVTTQKSDKEPLVSDTAKQEPRTSTTVKKLGLFTIIGISIVLTQVVCEVAKQVSNYSLQYFSNGQYPVPQTIIVVLIELIKLVATIIRSKCKLPSFSVQSLRSSLRFLLPSILYAVNNNIYYAGLTLVPPPIWLILCSVRTVVTATIYKFVLRRHLTVLQFVGAFLIVISIAVAKTPDIIQVLGWSQNNDLKVNGTLTAEAIQAATVNAVPLAAILLAGVASCNSVGAAVYTEQLFKSGGTKGESFLDQQFWLYLYGAMVASMVHFISKPAYTFALFTEDVLGMSDQVKGLFLVALLFASLGGLVVASILKYLDNIVKEYTGSVANILTAVACSFLFPDKFKFTLYIILSMACLLSGIYLYETKKVKTVETTSEATKK